MFSTIVIGLLILLAIAAVVFRKPIGWQLATYLVIVPLLGAIGLFLFWNDGNPAYERIVGAYVLSLAGASLFFGVIEFGILRIVGLFRLGAIVRITYYEALLQPFTLIVVVLGIAAISIFAALPYFTMGEDFKMFRDVAISLAFLFSLPIMVFASTKVIDEEIENRTMLTLMSKPIARWQVVLGKYFGVLLLCLGVIVALGLVAGTCAYLRYFDDMRIDYYVARTPSELAGLNLQNTKAVLAIVPAIFMEFLQIAMLAAVSVAVSTRWGLALNVTVTVLLYVGANLVRYAGTMDLPAPLSWMVAACSHILPGLGLLDLNQRLVYGNFNYGDKQFWTRSTPTYGDIWQYVGLSTAYAVFYVGGILSFGIALFRTRELTYKGRRIVYDCIILGGGPAGLSAAVYLGRYLRPTLVLNHRKPQTRWHRPIAHNILGFPAGIHRNQLLDWGREHVARYKDVEVRQGTVCAIGQVKVEGHDLFEICDEAGETFRSRGLILAMGVEYELPEVEGIWDYAGHTVWHCPECDGYKTIGKKIAVIGADRGSVEMALTATVWTKEITLMANGQPLELDEECSTKLNGVKIEVLHERITRVTGNAEEGQLSGIELEGGRRVEVSGAFVNLPCKPPKELLGQLPLELDKGRWVKVDHRMRTNIPKCYAAGDIVAHAQTQLSVAMGTGATAAIWLHKELLPAGICLSGREW